MKTLIFALVLVSIGIVFRGTAPNYARPDESIWRYGFL